MKRYYYQYKVDEIVLGVLIAVLLQAAQILIGYTDGTDLRSWALSGLAAVSRVAITQLGVQITKALASAGLARE